MSMKVQLSSDNFVDVDVNSGGRYDTNGEDGGILSLTCWADLSLDPKLGSLASYCVSSCTASHRVILLFNICADADARW